MNMGDLSIFLYLLQFLSLVLFIVQVVNMLSLFLGIFETIMNGIAFLSSFSVSPLLVYRKATGF
jgi:hypothetical protein